LDVSYDSKLNTTEDILISKGATDIEFFIFHKSENLKIETLVEDKYDLFLDLNDFPWLNDTVFTSQNRINENLSLKSNVISCQACGSFNYRKLKASNPKPYEFICKDCGNIWDHSKW
tara:strand:+ start:3588 stop:3938 length:351 start_codon:yes stop_codon:yes gene_type:complete